MRRLGKSILATFALLLATPAAAQPLPQEPIPYTKIAPKAAPARSTAAAPATPAAAPVAPPRSVPGARLSAGQALAPLELEAFVDGWMTDAMRREHIAGATVSLGGRVRQWLS